MKKVNSLTTNIENKKVLLSQNDTKDESKKILEEYFFQISNLKNMNLPKNDKMYEILSLKLLNWFKTNIKILENEIDLHKSSFSMYRNKLGKELEKFSDYQNQVKFINFLK